MKSRRYGKSHPRSSFTPEEDYLLKELVSKYGINSWVTVSLNMEKRNPRQCKDRYMSYLSPAINNGPYSEEEDNLLLRKYQELGPKWVKISKFFNNRTDISIKCRWAILNRRILKSNDDGMINKKPNISINVSEESDPEYIPGSSFNCNSLDSIKNNNISTNNQIQKNSETIHSRSKMSLRKHDKKHISYKDDEYDELVDINDFIITKPKKNQKNNSKVSNTLHKNVSESSLFSSSNNNCMEISQIENSSQVIKNMNQTKNNKQENTIILPTFSQSNSMVLQGQNSFNLNSTSTPTLSVNSKKFEEKIADINKKNEEEFLNGQSSVLQSVGAYSNPMTKTENQKNDFFNIFSNSFNKVDDNLLKSTEKVVVDDFGWDMFCDIPFGENEAQISMFFNSQE